MSPDEDGVRDDDSPTYWVSSSGGASTAPAAEEERSSRARSARSRQREQKRRAAGVASESRNEPGGAVVLSRGIFPIPRLPAGDGSAPLALEGAVPSQGHPAELITPGAPDALQVSDAPKRTLQTSIVTPHDFPPNVSLTIKIGDQTQVVRIGPNSDLVTSGAGGHWNKGGSMPEPDGKALEAQGYRALKVQVPGAGGSSRSRASMKTYTVYVKTYFVEEREGHEDVEVASGGQAPEESRRKRAARLRKREARRRAALRQQEAPAVTPPLAPSASASASASSSSSASASGITPGQG